MMEVEESHSLADLAEEIEAKKDDDGGGSSTVTTF
jgi:hypothetical protein